MAQTTQELINELEAESDRIRKQLSAVNESLREARVKRAFEAHQIRIGSIVENNGEQFKVVGMRRLYFDPPWVDGVKRKKDGEWSIKQQCLYSDWKVITP